MKSSEMMKSSGRSLRLPLPPPPYVRMSNEEVGSLFKGSGSSCARSMGSLKSSSSSSSPSSFSSSSPSSFSSSSPSSFSSPSPSSFSSPSKILPFLFVGNQADANDLKKLLQLNISFILSLTTDPTPSDASNHFEDYGIRFKRLPVADHCKENLMQHFEEAFNFIDAARKSGSNVLIHCQAGISRSPTIAIGYLVRHKFSPSVIEAYQVVKSCRPIISPNISFMGQLLELESKIKNNDKHFLPSSNWLPDNP